MALFVGIAYHKSGQGLMSVALLWTGRWLLVQRHHAVGYPKARPRQPNPYTLGCAINRSQCFDSCFSIQNVTNNKWLCNPQFILSWFNSYRPLMWHFIIPLKNHRSDMTYRMFHCWGVEIEQPFDLADSFPTAVRKRELRMPENVVRRCLYEA